MNSRIGGRIAGALLLALAVVLSPGPGGPAADQTDARLEPLFERLRTTTVPREAYDIGQQIWHIWRRIKSRRGTVLMARGITAMQQRNFPIALAAFDEVVRLAPDYAEGWNKRATVYYLMDNNKASIADILRTLQLEPRHFGAISGLGLNYLEIGEDKLALGAFLKALQINPHLTDARHQVEQLKRRLGGKAI